MESSSLHEHSHLKNAASPATHKASCIPFHVQAYKYIEVYLGEMCTGSQGRAVFHSGAQGADGGTFQRDPVRADMLGHTRAQPVQGRQAHTHPPEHSAHVGDVPAGVQLHTNHPKMCPKRHMHRQKA